MRRLFRIMTALLIVSHLFILNVNLVEARNDYYCGYDEQRGCDLYIDTDSVRATGSGNGFRKSMAHMYWTNGFNTEGYVVYSTKYGVYNFSGGAGGYYVPEGGLYNFCVICDRIAYK